MIQEPPEWVRELSKQDHEAFAAEVVDRLKFQQEIAMSSLKTLTLANGGAIIALFTFIGSSAKFNPHAIWWGFVCFVVGMVCVIAAHIGGYFSQAHFMNDSLYSRYNAQRQYAGIEERLDSAPFVKIGNRFLYGAVASVLVSLASFAIGSGVVLSGVLP